MNTKIASMVAALALGLGGCATDPGMGGMVYRDGGYYAPARDGYGDYYVAPEVSDDWYGDPFYGPGFDPFGFGPNWYGGGSGYCSVRYRYCPSGWYGGPFAYGFGTSLWIGFGGRQYYDPWGGDGAWAYAQPWGHRHRPGSSHDGRPHHSPPATPEGAPSGLVGRIAVDDDDADFGPGDDSDGRLLDATGDPRQVARPTRRRLMRRQPAGMPLVLGSVPGTDPQPVGPAAGGWPVQRSGGGQERSARAEGGERMRASNPGTGARQGRRARDD